ncbi:EscU/YscU/HrcU family type III secretion system export apparatus switch protein [Sphingosinithalassobacter portus]|uniref:EscU/YscU/HrcU family type III secretion system export apparatus switch protein n=1 Tax=Stakelama portus TaxID=2676234 RepID=UPI000D6EAB4D|nr:EscU/YscU/HrcU family type III secretion system export apparatus switch protein [Sphingosinithalassobacter portus]
MAEQQDQNRSEAPTPYKLKRARERGMVARSSELGFMGGLAALGVFLSVAGRHWAGRLADLTGTVIDSVSTTGGDPEQALSLAGQFTSAMFAPVLLFGGTALAIILLLEIIQLRGLVFSAEPLKPDFSRLNPATGLKRLFSTRMLKETLKTVFKALVYGVATWLLARDAASRLAEAGGSAVRLSEAMFALALRTTFTFAGIALAFVLLDQILVRGEFLKQMRMSRREITRETKDREGDPRLRHRRKQLHAEFAQASQSKGKLPGSDLLVVNPQHFAVALRYRAEEDEAPIITAKGRNRFALALREEAARLGMPVFSRPPLARALFRACSEGEAIPGEKFREVAEIYGELLRSSQRMGTH